MHRQPRAREEAGILLLPLTLLLQGSSDNRREALRSFHLGGSHKGQCM